MDELGLQSFSSESFIEEENRIKWINIIFLPFKRWWQAIIMATVFLKCIFGPMASIYSFVNCNEGGSFYDYFVLYYKRFGDIVYISDTFLYVIHRQVQDEAMKREYMPKPAIHLLLDILGLIPFNNLISKDACANSPRLIPNILTFSELFVIYRLFNYFKLITSHSKPRIYIGFIVITIIICNVIICLFILMTKDGLCPNCNRRLYDWRLFDKYEIKKGLFDVHLRVGWRLLLQLLGCKYDGRIPNTIKEYIIDTLILEMGYLVILFIVMPKYFAEHVMDLEPLQNFNPRVLRVIAETKRRNPDPIAHTEVEKYYSMIWSKKRGMFNMPEMMMMLPEYMRYHLKIDIIWPVFVHSPVLRNTSPSFQRCLSEHIEFGVKHAAERFFTGPSCYSKLYYLSAGIVQLIAADDSTAPMLSVTSGTIFGDISFLLPPMNRKVMMRCFTHCDVFSVSRQKLLLTLHKFPEDRKIVMKRAKERIQHARNLYNNKTIKGIDRAEDEGISWVKYRWWELSEAVNTWKMHKRQKNIDIPPEESEYHCSKYIGQLVLCEDIELRAKSVFAKESFPWILTAHSSFSRLWYLLIKITACISLLVIPMHLTRKPIRYSFWCTGFNLFVDLLYTFDVIVLLMTAKVGIKNVKSITDIIVERCKNKYFILDVLSTPLFDILATLVELKEFELVIQYNRLLKTYMLFCNRYEETWNKDIYPLGLLIFRAFLCYFCFSYISSFFLFWIAKLTTSVSYGGFYGNQVCFPNKTCQSSLSALGVMAIPIAWIVQSIYGESITVYKKTEDNKDIYVIVGIILFYTIIGAYWKSKMIAVIYLKQFEAVRYRTLVSDLLAFYKRFKIINPELLTRLERYLLCHWKYYKGMDILHPKLLRDEPGHIYWDVHGAAAEKLIGASNAFRGADPALVRELAHKARFIIHPKSSIIVMFGMRNENAIWLFRGIVKCDYLDADGKMLTFYYEPGLLLSMNSVFLGKSTTRGYTAASECEILYISRGELLKTIKKFPQEWSYFEIVRKEFESKFDEQFILDIKRHSDYQKKNRSRGSNKSAPDSEDKIDENTAKKKRIPKFIVDFRTNPESTITKHWMMLRAMTFFLSLMIRHFKDGFGEETHNFLTILGYVFYSIGILDVFLKLIIPYYDDKTGLIISHIPKCVLHYITRGFLVDAFALVLAQEDTLNFIVRQFSDETVEFISIMCSYSQIYLFIGYFNYITDVPSKYSLYVKILEWQLLMVLLIAATSQYFFSICISFERHQETNELISIRYLNETCWIPDYLHVDKNPSPEQVTAVFLQSINIAQCAVVNMFLSDFISTVGNVVKITFVTIIVFSIFKYQIIYCIIMLVLKFQTIVSYQQEVIQLDKFLKSERVDKSVIERTNKYFDYFWERTRGTYHRGILSNKRIGFVLRQDLTVNFYKKCYEAANTLLHGGEALKRLLCSETDQVYFLPNEDIVREMDLSYYVYFMYRGTAAVWKNDEKLVVLTMGSIFGQLEGNTNRPLQITVRTLEHVDVLRVKLDTFQNLIDDNIRQNIKANPESVLDYMAIHKVEPEVAENTLTYILRDKKSIHLPWMKHNVTVDSNVWYVRWLFFALIINPLVSSALTLLFFRVPKSIYLINIIICSVLDFLHVLYLATEFYTTETVIVNNQCVNKFISWKHFTKVWIYFDILSVTLPLGTHIFGSGSYFNLGRLLRIHCVFFFNEDLVRIQKRYIFALKKISLLCLLMHALTCGWIGFGCRLEKGHRYFSVRDVPIDRAEWRRNSSLNFGCPRLTPRSRLSHKMQFAFAREWFGDYVVALTYIVIIQTRINMTIMLTESNQQVMYKIFAFFILTLLEIWLASVAIDAVYTKYGDLCQFDVRTRNLMTFLKQCGMSRYLEQLLKQYTAMVWEKQKANNSDPDTGPAGVVNFFPPSALTAIGLLLADFLSNIIHSTDAQNRDMRLPEFVLNFVPVESPQPFPSRNWLPEITNKAPKCLREDIMSSLYMHHLLSPVLFQQLPMYFLRQVAVRMQRVVVFPGRVIVEEGDVSPIIYFIHEGEVERRFTDKNGEIRLSGVLTTNGYFGLIPGLFPNTPFQFSYSTRTIVDLITLQFVDWKDLMDCYPELKFQLYITARKLKM